MRTKLNDGEELILVLKKHWFIYVKPIMLLSMFVFFFGTIVLGDILSPVGLRLDDIIFFLVTNLFPLSYLIWVIIKRHYEIIIVTDHRLIREQGVFSSYSKESSLDKINNVEYYQSLFGRIFDFGNIYIQTAATEGTTKDKFIIQPKKFKETVYKHQANLKQLYIAEQAESLARAIRSEIGSTADTIACPHCAEIIKMNAKICRFCKSTL